MNKDKTAARIAGFMFLFYIAIGILSMVLFNQATGGTDDSLAKLTSIARHPTLMRLTAMLSLLTFFITVVLAVTLYKLTCAQNPILAQTALLCRAAEGMMNAFSALSTLDLLSVASASIVADTLAQGKRTHSGVCCCNKMVRVFSYPQYVLP